MTTEEAIGRIVDHMQVHKMGVYPHLKLEEALAMAIAALRAQQEAEIGEIKTAYDENGEPYLLEATGSEAKHIVELLTAEAYGRLRIEPEKNEPCECCGEHDNKDWSPGGTHDFRVRGDALCYYDHAFGWEGCKINYCPICGRKLGHPPAERKELLK